MPEGAASKPEKKATFSIVTGIISATTAVISVAFALQAVNRAQAQSVFQERLKVCIELIDQNTDLQNNAETALITINDIAKTPPTNYQTDARVVYFSDLQKSLTKQRFEIERINRTGQLLFPDDRQLAKDLGDLGASVRLYRSAILDVQADLKKKTLPQLLHYEAVRASEKEMAGWIKRGERQCSSMVGRLARTLRND